MESEWCYKRDMECDPYSCILFTIGKCFGKEVENW